MRRSLAVTSLLVLLAAATGCEEDGAGRELNDAERLLIQRAEQSLVKECMEDAGFAYWAAELPDEEELKGSGYVLTDPGWAGRHGYGSRFQDRLERRQREDRNHAYANALPEDDRVRYGRALEGGPSGGMLRAALPAGGTVQTPRQGCQAAAKGALYGDFEAWFKAEKTATNLSALYLPQLLADPRFTAALGAWAGCMREAGHDYADPPAAREALPKLIEGLVPEQAYAVEVDLAVTEATCATETPLATTARALESEYRERQLDRYGEDIATYERLGVAALARAERITGSSTTPAPTTKE
ncbi:hypothetical protein ABZX40_21900 [Streptomyces sp. NPDC004610]|uniref:hypothetical protein n=1 Tax=unclassified Streptomyces TaxID=2593676 RepID=UPI0033B854B9